MDIQQGDPNEGTWHLAHYPLPSHLGGQEKVALLAEHHAVQGVLQSEEFGVPCIWSWEGKLIPKQYEALYKKWMAVKGQVMCNAIPLEKKREGGRNGGHKSDKRKRIHLVNLTTSEEFIFASAVEAARELGLSACHLTGVARGEAKQHKGFTACYV